MSGILFFGGWFCSLAFYFYWFDKELHKCLKGYLIFLAAHFLFGSAMFYEQYSERSVIDAIGFSIFASAVCGLVVFVVLKIFAAFGGSSSSSASGGANQWSVFAYECRRCGWYQERSQRKTIWKCPECGRRGGIIPQPVG